MEEYSDEPIGNVIGQNPSKGETVQMEDEITLTISKGPDENIIQFKDSAFEKAVLDILGLQSGEPITRDLVKDIKELNLEDLDILSIEGIEAFESLEYLNASNNLIEEINELPSSLVYLDLSLNSLTELDLSSYTHLETAMVYMNELTKLPKFPSSIIEIDVSYNEIVDVSELKNYSKLKSVNVSDNLIEDFSALEEIYENLEYAFAEYNPGSFAFGEGSEDPSDGYTWATAMNPSYGINNSIIELFPYYHNLYISLLGVSIDDLLGVFSGLELTADDGNEQEYSYSDGGNRFVFYIDKETKSCVYYEFRLLDDPYFEGDLVISTEENNMGEDVVLLLGLPSEVFVGSYYVFLTYYTTDAVYKLIFAEEDSIFMLIVCGNEYYFE